MNQVEMICLEDLVKKKHRYRQFDQIWSFKFVEKTLKKLEKNNSNKGHVLLRLFKCLLLQFMENLSDRELELFIEENNAAKWFCGFNLRENTPDHSIFCQTRKKIGTKVLSKIFTELRDQLKRHGLVSEVFTFAFGFHEAAGLSLMASGCAMAVYNAKDLEIPNITWKNADVYAPERELPRDDHTKEPAPEANTPHTELGTREGLQGKYPQAREFDENGKPVRDIDFTDHGRPQNHPNPHQHVHNPNPTGGTPIRDPLGQPLPEWGYK